MTHVLELDSIQLTFGERKILSDIYIKCETGKIIGLLGRNGQGKSCLLNIIYGELSPEEKSIRFDKVTIIHAFKRPDLLLYLPQFNFFPGFLTVRHVFEDFHLDYSAFEDRFPEFAAKGHSKLRTLSGGQLRFVEVYIIVKARSQFALLDEPFTHLMPIQIEKVIDLILEEKVNKGFIITDHLYRHIINFSDRLYVLADGKTHLVKNLSDIEDLGYARL